MGVFGPPAIPDLAGVLQGMSGVKWLFACLYRIPQWVVVAVLKEIRKIAPKVHCEALSWRIADK